MREHSHHMADNFGLFPYGRDFFLTRSAESLQSALHVPLERPLSNLNDAPCPSTLHPCKAECAASACYSLGSISPL